MQEIDEIIGLDGLTTGLLTITEESRNLFV